MVETVVIVALNLSTVVLVLGITVGIVGAFIYLAAEGTSILFTGRRFY